MEHIPVTGARTVRWLKFGLISVLAPVATFVLDQQLIARIVWGSNRARFHLVADHSFDAVGPSDRTAVFTIGGMGVKDASSSVAVPLIPSLSDGISHSRLYALEEGTRMFLPDTVAAVDTVLADAPAGTVVFYGMSTGAKEMLYLAAHLRQHRPTARIVLMADSGPVDAHSAYTLRAERGLIGVGRLSARLRLFGGPVTNTAVDLTSGSTRRKSTDPSGHFRRRLFWPEVERVGRDVWSRQGTPNQLRIGQLALIADDSAATNLSAIAGDDVAPTTWFFYFAPSEDRTIDGRYAAARYAEIIRQLPVRANGSPALQFAQFSLPGLPHASERLFPEPYNKAVGQAVAMAGLSRPTSRDGGGHPCPTASPPHRI